MILGIGRALGEATAVSMVCGNAIDGPVFNLFDITRTLTSTMMLGLHETVGVDYDIRFSVGIEAFEDLRDDLDNAIKASAV